jgi:glutathione S-transferase
MKTTTSPSLTIYAFPRSWGLPNMSPYCAKLETWLRLAGIPHERAIGDLRKAPRGQMPYARLDGELIGDSDQIIDRMIARTGVDLDARVPEAERGRQRALARMLEESTVWVLRYGRFVDAGYADLRLFMDAILPPGLRVLLKPKIRGDMRKALHAQGLGRYSRDEIYAMGRRDLDAVAAELGDRPFFGGERPSRLDCTVFGFVGNFLCEHARSPMTEHVGSLPSLVAHTERMRERAFPEIASWIGRRAGGPIDEIAA